MIFERRSPNLSLGSQNGEWSVLVSLSLHCALRVVLPRVPSSLYTTSNSTHVNASATCDPVPTATSIPPTDPPPANVLLLYDDASFTVYNQGSEQLSIGSLRFQSDSGNWDASRWGNSLTDNFATTNCLRLRDSNSGQRQPPAICGTLLGQQLVAGNTLFWLNTDTFDVMVDGSIIATCSTTEESCGIFVP